MEHQCSSPFHFSIPLVELDYKYECEQHGNCSRSGFPAVVPQELIDSFRSDGFAVFRHVLSPTAVDALNDHLEDVLRGVYDRERKPDKIPRLVKGEKPDMIHEYDEGIGQTNENNIVRINEQPANTNKEKRKPKCTGIGPIGFSGNLENVKVLQIINIHKADSLFRKLETNAGLAKLVSALAGWDHMGGARLAQDQFWAKPPHAPPLVFHRDSPYFMFEPSDVVTVWLALDDMDPELGPLEYVPGSHLWGDGRVGSANQFFQSDTTSLLRSAAEREGIEFEKINFVSMAGLKRGGLSIHHGKIWHGSAKNASRTKPRRGLGLHFVPANVRFTAEASKSRLWKSYVANNMQDPSSVQLCEEDFPLSTTT